MDLSLLASVSYEQWAATHFTNPAAPEAARTADPDGDGAMNEQEYTAGIDPRDATSVFTIASITNQPDDSLILSANTIPSFNRRTSPQALIVQNTLVQGFSSESCQTQSSSDFLNRDWRIFAGGENSLQRAVGLASG